MTDARWMDRALVQARLALGSTAPNPAVGAVLVRDGVLLGEGHTQPVGGAHAEVMALEAAHVAGHEVAGATLYSTLEPCCHHGRTPPCTDAILAARVQRVVVGVVDPFPAMQGRSLGILKAAGLQVRLGVNARACESVVLGFSRTQQGGLPEVTLKVASSLDGNLATASGASQWITGPAARAEGHLLRARHDAILVGIGTVLADNPRLTCRDAAGTDPVPVVLDTELRVPADASLFRSSRRALVFSANDAPPRELAGDVVHVGRKPAGVDLVAVLKQLAERGLHRVLVEGGAQVHGSLLSAGLVDTLHLFLGPLLLPGGQPWLQAPPLDQLSDARRFGPPSVRHFGDDLLLSYRRVR